MPILYRSVLYNLVTRN